MKTNIPYEDIRRYTELCCRAECDAYTGLSEAYHKGFAKGIEFIKGIESKEERGRCDCQTCAFIESVKQGRTPDGAWHFQGYCKVKEEGMYWDACTRRINCPFWLAINKKTEDDVR